MVRYALTFATALLSVFSGASAFWRMECHGTSAYARIDPLMDFGTVSTHVHAIHGSSGFSESASFGDLRSGDCTSCAVPADMSSYWTPALYFQHADGTFELVPQVGGMLAYYLPRTGTFDEKVTAFPAGFRMLAGHSTRRNYTAGDPSQPDPAQSLWALLGETTQDVLGQRALGFNCLNYAKQPEAALYRHEMPAKSYLDANCQDGIRLELAFPSCWNGKDFNADKPYAHVAYPDLVQSGNCPLIGGFTTRLPTLFYETIWATNKFVGKEGQFVLAHGDVQGFGYHGDFMSGWDENYLQNALDVCTNDSGRIQDCAPFVQSGIQDEDKQRACKLASGGPSALAHEDTEGPNLKMLPGNVAIQLGPEAATIGPVDDGDAQATVLPTPSSSAPQLSYTPGSTIGLGAVYLESSSSPSPSPSPSPVETSSAAFVAAAAPPAATSEAPETSSSIPPPAPPAPTSAPSPSPSKNNNKPLSTEYRTISDKLVQEIVWEEELVYVTEDTVEVVTVSPVQKRQERRHKSHWARHAHHHGH